jgi:hypothetical protein
MRTFVLLLALVVSEATRADPRGCGDEALTREQLAAVLDGKPNGDPVLVEAMSLPRLKPPRPASPAKSPKPILWEQARAMILLGVVVELFETRDSTVTLKVRAGNTYVAKEPRDAAVARVLELVDPCHAFIVHIVE